MVMASRGSTKTSYLVARVTRRARMPPSKKRSRAAVEAASAATIDRFVDWLRDNGASLDGVTIRPNADGVSHGLFATDKLQHTQRRARYSINECIRRAAVRASHRAPVSSIMLVVQAAR